MSAQIHTFPLAPNHGLMNKLYKYTGEPDVIVWLSEYDNEVSPPLQPLSPSNQNSYLKTQSLRSNNHLMNYTSQPILPQFIPSQPISPQFTFIQPKITQSILPRSPSLNTYNEIFKSDNPNKVLNPKTQHWITRGGILYNKLVNEGIIIPYK